ncbi:MAG: hypothetical protein ACXU8U_03425 [Asticcacaulis sp.]
MKPTVLNVIIGVNIALLALIFILDGFHGFQGSAHGNAVLSAFALSFLNLCLGLICVVALLILNFVNKGWRDVADKLMQAFMIAFGLTLLIAVPACFAGMGMR